MNFTLVIVDNSKALLALLLALSTTIAASQGAVFKGSVAMEYTRKAVSFGPRPPDSAAIRKLRGYIISQLKFLRGCQVSIDSFQAQTPRGPMAMENVIAKFPGTSGRAVVFTGHYDTKLLPGVDFVGANDGGASTGLLLELARAVASLHSQIHNDVYLVWFDGEEAIGQWSETDGLHGSRHLASKWANDGMLGKLKALINVDMIGDKNLGIMHEMNSSPGLVKMVWQTAADLGYKRYFLDTGGATEDDHMPFVRAGVNAIDLIDFDYGPNNANWHTDKDTLDKLSVSSFQVVGDVLVEMLKRLER